MKPVDPQDKPKLIVLIVLSVAVLGYGLLQLTAGLADASPKAASAKGAETAPAVESSMTADASESAQSDSLSVVPDASAGDPFLPRFTVEEKPSAIAGGAPAVSGKPLPVLPDSVLASLGRPGSVPQGLPSPEPAAEGAGGKTAPVELAPPPPPSLNVEGLLVAESGTGGKSVAILAGSGEKRYVIAGDPVGNGYVVASVSLQGVEVVDPNNRSRRFTFSLPKR